MAPRLAGQWGPCTLEGPRSVAVNGVEFRVPELALVKVVRASGGLEVAHVMAEGRVTVLSAEGQLQESDDAARSRAHPDRWRLVAG